MIMKKILWICSVLLAMVSCQEDYELNTDFAVPTELSSPASIQLNVSSPTLENRSYFEPSKEKKLLTVE